MRPLLLGLLLWLAGTLTIRLAGRHLLLPGWRILALYAASFAAMGLLVPRILGASSDRRAAVTLLMLPTLILDGIACPFFHTIYPNVDPAAAGLFGGWMLICCGGAVTGVWLAR